MINSLDLAISSVILTQRKYVHKAEKKLHMRTKMKIEVPAEEDKRDHYMIMLQKCSQSW